MSYGSNLLRGRFERYLLGGTLPGLDVVYPGGPGTAPAGADRAVVLPGRLRLAGDAPAWGGGGVCFWDEGAPGPGVLARAWRVTLGQYLEVVHLEGSRAAVPQRRRAPWDDAVLRDGSATVLDGWYGRLVLAGSLEGEPALTFTSPAAARLPARPPSPRYREVVVAGLVETFGARARGGLDEGAAAAYVDACASGSPTGPSPPAAPPGTTGPVTQRGDGTPRW
ncbi:histone deacetylase [Aquipuribacter sp. SD81]|uniref:histone deacetylase n=1 Tax=Aquipuribacter sp. SD81 TaxID=3127703 RepID=UPI00301724AE